MSYERPGPVPSSSAGDGGGDPSTSRYSRLPSLEQPYNVPPNSSQPPPPLRDPVTLTGPNAPPLQQFPESERPVPGHPDHQQFPPFQGQSQFPGQPSFHRWDQNGQPMNPPLPHYAPTFDRPLGQTVGLTHRNSITFSMGVDMGPPRLSYPMVHQPSMYLPMRPQVHPQAPFQMNPQMPFQTNPHIPPHMNPQMPPQDRKSVV